MKFVYPVLKYRVIDGDTIEADLDLGFGITKNVYVRVFGVDTPEVRGDREKEAGNIVKEFCESWLSESEELYCWSIKRGKYANRTIGNFYQNYPAAMTGFQGLGQLLVQKGYALPYFGGTKSLFTEEQLQVIIDGKEKDQ